MAHEAFLIGGGQLHRIVGERGETPPQLGLRAIADRAPEEDRLGARLGLF